MRRHFPLLVAFAALASSVAGQAKHPFTFEDMTKLKRVAEPQVSPDGKWVIFSVTDVDLESNTKTPHVWIVPLNTDSHISQNQGDMGHPKDSKEASGMPHVSPNLRDVGGTEREIIADQDADRPRWAPDGKRFAFLSTKESGSQVWIADFDDATGTVTEKYRLTSIATEAGGELWSPDGKYILFTSDVYPECDGEPAAEAACNAKKLDEANKSKVKALVFEHLLYRHWNAYRQGKRSHLFVAPVLVQVHQYRDLTPGDYDAPVFSLGGQDDYAFSPDGKEICYASNHDKNPAASTNNDLWIVPVNGGADASSAQDSTKTDWVKTVLAHTKNITADNPASDTSPLYSPDGRYIAYRAQQSPGYESDRFRLMLYDRKTGRKREVPTAFDLNNTWVGTFAWDPDSSRIYFVSENQGESPIVVVRLNPGFLENDYAPALQGKAPEVVSRGFNDDLAVTPDGTTLVFARMSVQYPTEIYKLASKTPAAPFTHFNDALLSQVAMSVLEPFWFTGAHGDKVEGFLVKPPNFDASKKYPVKFLVHGGPQGAWGDDWSYRWNPELFAANGYVVIMINFHGSTGYGQKFIDSINGDWGGAPFEDLMKGLDYAEQTYPFIDKNRECALGASFGGYMINWILGHTDRFKCLVSHDGDFNNEASWGTTEEMWFPDWEFHGAVYDNREMYRKWSPHLFAKNFKTPTLVIHGQLDYRVDVSEGFQLFTTLQMLGVPSKMLYFPDEGHWVLKPQNSRLWYKTVNDWVDLWTKDQGIGK
jgi:dipeptidyl aminopeptidase/acylaminoacyl peptidase